MSCRECSGLGTLFVLPAYVDQQRPAVAEDDPEFDRVEALRASLANTVFPCPECRPEQFAAWSGGHYAMRPLGASSPSSVPRRTRGRRGQEPLPMEPTDIDPSDWSLTRADLA